ncbi:MAG: NERD domain-containing protein [Oscillospiraceae bacterium]|nr:NERD domain-containing protein [Oscillospiraceae bacterium]
MAKGLLDKLVDSVFDAEWTGKRGEKLTERELKLVSLFGRKGMTLRNLYIPKGNGETTEIDLVYITQKGIFVFESKNYSGWIFGDEGSQYWTVMLPNRQKNRFYNPIIQNRTHIKWLGKLVGPGIPLFSIIVFSERCELKQVTVKSADVRVIRRDRVYATVRGIWDTAPDAVGNAEISELYEKLKPLTEVDEAVKAAHIGHIKTTYQGNTSRHETETPAKEVIARMEAGEKLCPRCGKKLVIRTAKSGTNAGKQFWGCTGYPGCRYTEGL